MGEVSIPVSIWDDDSRPHRFHELSEKDRGLLGHDRGYSDWQDISEEDGLYSVDVSWREIANILARAHGWTDEGPAPDRGEGGPGLQLPSGLWLVVADIDLESIIDESP